MDRKTSITETHEAVQFLMVPIMKWTHGKFTYAVIRIWGMSPVYCVLFELGPGMESLVTTMGGRGRQSVSYKGDC
jgi:hypothetical protein